MPFLWVKCEQCESEARLRATGHCPHLERALFPSTLENAKMNDQLPPRVHETWTVTPIILLTPHKWPPTTHTHRSAPDVLSLSSMTLVQTGPQSAGSSMSTGLSVHPGSVFMGLALPILLLNPMQRKMHRILDRFLVRSWVQMKATTMIKSSWAVASKGKRRLSENRSSRTTSTPTMCNPHPSVVAGAKRRSASTSGRGTTLDCGPSTDENVRAFKNWRSVCLFRAHNLIKHSMFKSLTERETCQE